MQTLFKMLWQSDIVIWTVGVIFVTLIDFRIQKYCLGFCGSDFAVVIKAFCAFVELADYRMQHFAQNITTTLQHIFE